MDFTRQWDICNPNLIQDTSVCLIGTGGIGAVTALGLAKLGVGFMVLYDDDTVDPENIPTQFLKLSDIGIRKVNSVAVMLREFSDIHGTGYFQRVHQDSKLPSVDIVISSVDTITARQEIWHALLKHWSVLEEPRWYLDARMGAEIFQLYTVDMQDRAWYDGLLSSLTEDMVPDEPCTAKSTIYTALIAGGHVCHAVKRIVMSESQPKLVVHNIKADSLIVP